MDRSQKTQVVSELRDIFSSSVLMVVTRHNGLTVADATGLRGKMREEGARFRVIKNRLAKIALEGTPYESLGSLFKGPTAIAYSDDPVAAARAAVSYAKEDEKLEILGGAMGDQELGVDGVKALAELPSLDELRAKIVGMISTPATRIAGVLQAPGGQLARVLSAYASKDKAA